jgi:hypothetical protein
MFSPGLASACGRIKEAVDTGFRVLYPWGSPGLVGAGNGILIGLETYLVFVARSLNTTYTGAGGFCPSGAANHKSVSWLGDESAQNP